MNTSMQISKQFLLIFDKNITKLSQEKQLFLRAARLQKYSSRNLHFVNLKLCLYNTQLHYQL